MAALRTISTLIIPTVLIFVLVAGLMKKTEVYTCFLEGAKDGIQVTLGIIPALIGLVVAINMLKASGAIEWAARLLDPILKWIGMPGELLPLALLRPVSGSGSLGIVKDILQTYGPDSYQGRLASVMMGSTETTFYTVAIYFGAVGIKNIRHTLKVALTADLIAMLSAVIVTRIFFSI